MQGSPYDELKSRIAEIDCLAKAGEWEAAAASAARLQLELLPPAKSTDLATIKAALAVTADLGERTEYLRRDLSNLLKAFGPTS